MRILSPKPWERTGAQIGWDTISWVGAGFVAWALRYDFAPPVESSRSITFLVALLVAAQILLGFVFGVYRGRFRTGSIDEVSVVAMIAALVGFGATLIVLALNPSGIPRSVPLITAFLALVFMLAARISLRVVRLRAGDTKVSQPALVYGAGYLGESLVQLMLSDPSSSFRPVAMLDDDPRKQNYRSYGISVRGNIDDLAWVSQRTGATTLIVAISRIDASRIRQLTASCDELDMDIRFVPRTAELIGRDLSLSDLSSVSIEDFLGRRVVETDMRSVSQLFTGQRVLITGAGGSIGSELAKQVDAFNPSFLGLLDRDESALQSLELRLTGRGLLQAENLILADVRDAKRLGEVFEATRPSVVLHAAALKHLSMLEKHPGEALKTNVFGTSNLLDLSQEFGVQTFVNISTDKAADPSSVLGLSKLITERLVAGVPASAGRRFLSVRFGNVLGSSGSMLNTFRSQINSGQAITVTDPETTRYFMTPEEAIQLVLQAAVLGESGSTLILDMGQPVRIIDVARQLIELSGVQVPIEIVGLRPGEKLHEKLQSEREVVSATHHPLITSVRVKPLSGADLKRRSSDTEPLRILTELSGHSPASAPQPSGAPT